MEVKSNGHHVGDGDKTNGDRVHTSSHDKSPRDIYGVIKDFDADSPHPFIYRLYPTTTDKIIWAVMMVTLAPIKLLFVISFIAIACIPASLAVWGLPLEPDEPLTGWRRQLKFLTTYLVRCAWFSAGLVSQTVTGKQASSKEAPIIGMGPHSSFIDTLGGAICGFPGVVSVIENAYIPVINKLFRVNESIYVRRNDPNSRKKCAQELKKRATSNGKWNQVVVFPEGVCSVATALLPYKLGCFLPGVPIQPVTVKYNNRLDVTTWVNTGPGLLALFSLLLCTPYTRFELTFHPVYNPSEEEKMNPELYADNYRTHMSKLLGLPKIDLGLPELMSLVKTTKPKRGVFDLWKAIFVQGYVEMPDLKQHSN